MSNKNENLALVVIEDNEEDLYSIKRVFNSIGNPVPITHYLNGELALEALKEMQTINYKANIVILLDLNLPGINGYDIAKKIRNMQKFAFTPIIIFTSSASTSDIDLSYKSGANSFVKKHVDFQKFSEAIVNIKTYWFETNLLPIISQR